MRPCTEERHGFTRRELRDRQRAGSSMDDLPYDQPVPCSKFPREGLRDPIDGRVVNRDNLTSLEAGTGRTKAHEQAVAGDPRQVELLPGMPRKPSTMNASDAL